MDKDGMRQFWCFTKSDVWKSGPPDRDGCPTFSPRCLTKALSRDVAERVFKKELGDDLLAVYEEERL